MFVFAKKAVDPDFARGEKRTSTAKVRRADKGSNGCRGVARLEQEKDAGASALFISLLNDGTLRLRFLTCRCGSLRAFVGNEIPANLARMLAVIM